MRETTFTCDKCHEAHTSDGYRTIPTDWREIELKAAQYNYKTYLLCTECQKAIGIYKERSQKEPPIETIQDRLFAVIEEIVLNNIPNT